MITYIIAKMVVRESLLHRCRKVAGQSNNFGFTIQLLDDHLSILIADHDRHVERVGRLDLDLLSRMEMLSTELRDPQSLMLYFQALKDSAKHDLIQVCENQRVIIYLRSIEGDYFPFFIQTVERVEKKARMLHIDQDTIARMIDQSVNEKMALKMKQLSEEREKQLRERMENLKDQISQIQGPMFSLCSRGIIIFLLFFIAALLIAGESRQQRTLDPIFDKGELEEAINKVFERSKNTMVEPSQMTSLQAKVIEVVTSIYSKEFENIKEWMNVQLNLVLDLKEELQMEKSVNLKQQLLLQYLEQQISSLEDYLSLNGPNNSKQRQ